MDNKMAVFNNREFGSIRVIEQNGNYLFCGKDIAKALGYQRTADAISAHCKGVCVLPTPSNGGIQQMKFISEGDVYRLIVHSRLPGAERFEKWVFDEVLPMIRKTGGYMTASLLEQAAEKPEILLAFADQLLAEHEKNRQLSGEVERLRPKADFYDAFVHEENCTNNVPGVHLDDISVNRHLPQVGADPLCLELGHLLFHQFFFLGGHIELHLDISFSVCHRGISPLFVSGFGMFPTSIFRV